MRELTIEITNKCPHHCEYCSTDAASVWKQMLSIEALTDALHNQGFYDLIIISGGEPLCYPEFSKIVEICRARLQPQGKLRIATNLIDEIAFNGNVRDRVRVIENIQTHPDTDEVHILKTVAQGREARRPDVHLSGNWTDDCDGCDSQVIKFDRSWAKAPCKKGE